MPKTNSMRRKIAGLSPKEARHIAEMVFEALYTREGGEDGFVSTPDTCWGPETLDAVADALGAYGLLPRKTEPW